VADPLELLSSSTLFRDLSSKDVAAIVALSRRVRHARRVTVVRQGDPGGDVFLILRGFLMAAIEAANGRETGLGVMGPGDLFGEIALFDGAPRSASVTTLTSVDLLVIEKARFLSLLEANPRLSIRLLAVMARRLRRLSERSDDITGMRVGDRIGRQLLRLAERFGQPEGPNRVRISLQLSQQKIGELAGATRESVNQNVSVWSRAGLIEKQRGYLTILDLGRFRRLHGGSGDRLH
jgi:CRP/FNR family transcriptional regulator, cyclic AMP receptor protein